MARKKTIQTAVEETNETQEVQVENTKAQESATASTEKQESKKEAIKSKGGASGYAVTWKAQAGKTVKGLNGVLMSFDKDGKANGVDAENAKRLLKIKGVEIVEA